jgi:hypothetical protein
VVSGPPFNEHSQADGHITVRYTGSVLMLAHRPIDVMLLSSDVAAAKEFYHERIGLYVLPENDDFVT